MPPKKKSGTRRQVKSLTPTKRGDDEIDALARCAEQIVLVNHWSTSYADGSPYVIYAFNHEDHMLRRLYVEIFAPNVPDHYIKDIHVTEDGNQLSVLIGVPRWFYSLPFMKKRLGDAYHPQHSVAESFHNNVTQPVNEANPGTEDFVLGKPFLIELPEPCKPGQISFQRGTFLTKGMPKVQNKEQYNWILTCKLNTKKEFVVHTTKEVTEHHDEEM